MISPHIYEFQRQIAEFKWDIKSGFRNNWFISAFVTEYAMTVWSWQLDKHDVASK